MPQNQIADYCSPFDDEFVSRYGYILLFTSLGSSFCASTIELPQSAHVGSVSKDMSERIHPLQDSPVHCQTFVSTNGMDRASTPL